MEFKVGDQAIVRRRTITRGPATNEIRIGRILALGEDGVAKVSFPLPGGRVKHEELPIDALAPVTGVFARTTVQFNPAFRQIYKGSV